MVEIQSGRELCDKFFEDLKDRGDIDPGVAALLVDLYSKGELSGGAVLEGLKTLRAEEADERKSQT